LDRRQRIEERRSFRTDGILLGRALLTRMVGSGSVMVRAMMALALGTLVSLASLMVHDQP
jgi:hypothetical protein